MFVIRRAKLTDNEAVERVHLRAIKETCASHYTPEEIEAWARPRTSNYYVESISNNDFYVAEENGVVVGFGTLNQERGEIEAVYVLPEVARRGIGLKILRKLEERARELGVKSLRLNSSLNATAFYKSAGYKPREESKHRLTSGVEIGCVLMTKELSP